MAHNLTWYSRDGTTENIICYVTLKRRLAGSVQDTKVYRSSVIDVKIKDRHLVVSRVNLKLRFQKGNFIPRRYDAGRLRDEYLREIIQEQLRY